MTHAVSLTLLKRSCGLGVGSHREKSRAYLRWHAKHVGIILHKPPHSRQSGEGTAGLVSVDDPKFCHTDREFFVAAIA